MPRCVLSFFFLVFSLFTKQRQKSRWWITEKSEEICLNLCPRPPFSLVSSCSLLVRALERTLSTQPGARWRNTQPSWREPNNRGRCPETQFSSRRGVSRAILREYLSPCLSLSSPPVLKVFLPPPLSILTARLWTNLLASEYKSVWIRTRSCTVCVDMCGATFGLRAANENDLTFWWISVDYSLNLWSSCLIHKMSDNGKNITVTGSQRLEMTSTNVSFLSTTRWYSVRLS